ncbi:MAG: hypothetical protein GY930_03755 [bacterium]|nr:hypothetical protein [bacterium]
MKSIHFLTPILLATSLLMTACGQTEEEPSPSDSGSNAVGDFNLGGISSLASDLTAKLGEIKDLPSAKKISAKVGPMLDQLAAAKGKIDVQDLVESAKALKARFATKEDILLALQPLLDRIAILGK